MSPTQMHQLGEFNTRKHAFLPGEEPPGFDWGLLGWVVLLVLALAVIVGGGG